MLSHSIEQVTTSAMTVLAHAGHGHSSSQGTSQGNTLWHYISEPQHAWVLSAVILVIAAVAYSGLLFRETSHD